MHLVNGTPHGDLGVSQAGDQVFVSYEGITGQSLSMVNLTTGVATGHWDDNGTSGLYGGHLSTRNIDRPGWAYISEGENPSAVDNNNAFLEILAVKLDGSGIVERFCKTNARNSNTKYYHQAQACPSPDGKKVIFKSDWDDGTLEANTYAPAWVVERVEPTLSLNYFEKRINYNEMYCDIYNHELKHLYNGQLKDFNKETHTVYTIVFDKKTLRRIYLK